ncbi:metallophosphoesterase [Caenimonas koreensis]|uniref:Metallophosphoesterase n=1 Tax=Caenimonas koreensis DSM 17982 TaxID=1121255 RepID=A0A844AUJ9_9BURK|nr:metallophosphoesterase [Caenimonas koreensis]MRD48180.1 metallophosphoesterase [Caenimonas koreensis DSM 17982]
MSILLHISDTHFGTEIPAVVAALQALVRERRPDVLVYSGDMTQRARASQFAAARAMCDSFDIPRMLALPGNHDVPLFNLPARLAMPYRGYLKYFGPRLDSSLETDDFLVIGVNTTRASRHKDGEVSGAQIVESAERLKSARPRQLRIVVTHQPAVVLREEDEPDRLHNADAALQAWSSAGADLVLGGHIHLPYVADLTKISPATPRAMWCVQAGTAVSSRIRHDTHNSVNLIHWQPGAADRPRKCKVERCDYRPADGWFATQTIQELALG